jgi:hypothetical protein
VAGVVATIAVGSVMGTNVVDLVVFVTMVGGLVIFVMCHGAGRVVRLVAAALSVFALVPDVFP